MTTVEKRRFIRQLANAIKKEALVTAKRMPQSWDGHELREYLSDKFNESRSRLMTETRSARRRAYTNDCANLNL